MRCDPKGGGASTTRARYSRERYRHIDDFSRPPGVLTTLFSNIDHHKIQKMTRDRRRKGMYSKLVWSDDDIRYLCEHFCTDSNDDIARHFGISAPAVSVKARSLGLSKTPRRSGHVWTDAELKYLMDNYGTMAACDIADHLGVSDTLIHNKAKDLGLKKSKSWCQSSYTGRYVRNYKNNESGRWNKEIA